MIALELDFEKGKYHATKWGRNVDEGFIDWPPSPWRLLRAIISSWKIYRQDITDDVMCPILNKMQASKVLFNLPPAIQSHTRHYVPLPLMAKDKVKKTKMLDLFIAVKSPVYAIWTSATLDKSEENILKGVLENIRYIGRSESLCNVTIFDGKIMPNCTPLDENASGDMEIVDVLVPTVGAKLEELCVNVRDLHKKKLIFPPGSTSVKYARSSDSLSAMPNASLSTSPMHATVIRYAIRGRINPMVTETARIGDSFKRTAMYVYGKRNPGCSSSTLSGLDANGDAMRENHNHAFFLPTDEDCDGRLDHVTVVAKNPFDPDVMATLTRIGRIRYGGEHLRVTYSACGRQGGFKAPILQSSKYWVSDTPYVLSRHMKTSGAGSDMRVKDGPEDQITREIRLRGMPDIKSVKVEKGARMHGFIPLQFKRLKQGGSFGFEAYMARIEFEGDVTGPLSLGHASHLGLGIFVPDDQARRQGGIA